MNKLRVVFLRFIILFSLGLVFLTILAKTAKASQVVLSVSATPDCSNRGGYNNQFNNFCLDDFGTNSFVTLWSWENSQSVPAYQFVSIPGHNYSITFDSSTFQKSTYDFIQVDITSTTNYNTDPNVQGEWVCSAGWGCGAQNNSEINFQAMSSTTYIAIVSACNHSSPCHLSNIIVTDLDMVGSPTPTPTPTLEPTPTETPTPIPTLSPTPTPSPSPTTTPSPTPLPVTKIIFAPGGGASWNADAILNCKTSGYSGDWSLAPYAQNVYDKLLTELSSSNWNTKPFYYDWRSDVRNNATLLSNFINNNSSSGEKVDLVGHSMGGLVERAYIESQHNQKVSSFISAGSPYQGDALAYPVWSGNEIWDDNFITKIATTIYLNRCGKSTIPSIQNLLPTTDYLRDSKTKQLKPVANMNVQNNWLPTNFVSPFWGVRVGTLSGNSFPTLKIIDVTNPSNNDIKHGNWLDGKPNKKEFTNQGDGTVLTESSQIFGASVNNVINQNHEGLVASSEGINSILTFLGTPPVQGFNFVKTAFAASKPNKSIYVEPNSMLVIIGYPGNFWITDKNGNVTHDQNGMIALTNPMSGNYQLDIVPQSNNTLFVVTQLLPDGQTLYKEYHFTNLQPKTKVIAFDSKHSNEDILKDKSDYKRPPEHDNWWWFFWKFPFKH